MKNANNNADQNFGLDDSIWYILAEFSLSEFLSDRDQRDGLTGGLLRQSVQELGILPEWEKNLEMTLAGFAEEALHQCKQGGTELPGRVRLFCQKKIIGDMYSGSAAARPYHSEQPIEHGQILLHSGARMSGGWGFFLVKRGRNPSTGSPAGSWNSIDLYLYKEGG